MNTIDEKIDEKEWKKLLPDAIKKKRQTPAALFWETACFSLALPVLLWIMPYFLKWAGEKEDTEVVAAVDRQLYVENVEHHYFVQYHYEWEGRIYSYYVYQDEPAGDSVTIMINPYEPKNAR